MCEEKDRSKNAESTSEHSSGAGLSSTFRSACPPDCCVPMIERMTKALAESSNSQTHSPDSGNEPDAGASCAPMMQRMMDICGCTPAKEEAGSDRSKHSSEC